MKKLKPYLLGLVFSVLCLVTATAAALGLLHSCDLLYRIYVDAAQLPETTGYSREIILRNYHDAMRYLSPFSKGEFELSDLAYSEDGAQHFTDVKNIFNAVYLSGAVSALGIAAIAIYTKKRGRRDFLRISGIATFALPVVLTAAIVVNFDAIFVLFHKLFFSNDNWIFDVWRDEIINILPGAFFLCCAAVIIVFWIVAALLQYWAGSKKNKNKKRQIHLPKIQ